MSPSNILILMVDQLSGVMFPNGPADWLHAPNLKALAEKSTCFQNAYNASPLCTPARASFMTGLLPSRTGVYDNAAELHADIPTYAHHLRRAGYYTCLAGKMHFVGPDQLHGFEERLTTDIYPADFGWTPDYRKPGERIDWWYHNMGSVVDAGVAEITNQMEFDDEVENGAIQKLYQLSRGLDSRPWSLTVSFTHPHDPYVARPEFWDLYADCTQLDPQENAYDFADYDPHSQRIMQAIDYKSYAVSKEHVRRARRAYYANISYLDEKIGKILGVLEKTQQSKNTSIVFLSDHGDMLGEKGLWYKMSFFEGASRIPLMIHTPQMPPSLVTVPVSALDVVPTLADIANIAKKQISPWTQGESLMSLGQGGKRSTPVRMEYAAEASYAPLVSWREGRWKYNRCQLDPDQLFDLQADPLEKRNLAKHRKYAGILADFQEKTAKHWDLETFDQQIRDSQARRWVVNEALRMGKYTPWDFEPQQHAAERYMRNHMDLNNVEVERRFPK